MAVDEEEKRTGGHTVADHGMGMDLYHDHDDDADHDHDYIPPEERLEDNPIWIQDHVTLHSVGIDIGSSGTQVVFSRINLRRLGEDLTSRYYVTSRETLFQSPVALTPYQNEERIDDDRLRAIIDDAYKAANIHPDDIDTGVVILTGEALRRENAKGIAKILSEQGGEFVCATAGHHMESMLAAYGSGAARVSHDENKRLLNIDIGGGTTKLGLVEKGKVIATAAFHVGGRLQVVDENMKIIRLDPAGKHHAKKAGFDWKVGDTVTSEQLDKVAEGMARAVIEAVSVRPMPHDTAHLYLTDPIAELGQLDGVMFSGGVGEYVYGRETRDFGDMGKRVGTAIRRLLDANALPWPALPGGECIRATALGASEYSVQLSGNTCYISNPGKLLPRRNLQVLKPNFVCEEVIDPDKVAQAIRGHFTAFDLTVEGDAEVALAFSWLGAPAYERIAAFAEGIKRAMAPRIKDGRPIYVMLDGDIAQTMGAIMREELDIHSEILVIDGVVLLDFDYIDLGRIRMPSNTVPVTIKSLVFSEDPRGPMPRERLHHQEQDHGHKHGRDHKHDHGHGHKHDHDHKHGHDHKQGDHAH